MQIGVAFFGHNLVQTFERFAFPVLAVVFAVGAVFVLAASDPSAVPDGGGTGGVGGFLLMLGAVFGYTAGWAPYAADYTRYLPADAPPRWVGLAAGSGLFVSTTLLMVVGRGVGERGGRGGRRVGQPDDGLRRRAAGGGWPALTLLCIALGAVAANVLNVYSGAMAFLSMGIDVPLRGRGRRRAGLRGGRVRHRAVRAGRRRASYEAFLLVIVYWIGPWLGVVLADQYLRRDTLPPDLLYDRGYANPAGLIAMLVGHRGVGAAVLQPGVVHRRGAARRSRRSAT